MNRIGRNLPRLLFLAAAVTQGADRQGAMSFEQVRAVARELSTRPFDPPTNALPAALTNLSYTEFQKITFKPDKALWRPLRLPFEVEFFHPGYVHQNTVTIHEFDERHVRVVPFDSELFNYGGGQRELPGDLGFAGFRITYPAARFGEVAVFVGASYFRMIGQGQTYGTSARGLALDTVKGQGEEFPAFREFWLRRPAAHDKEVTVCALLDGPSVTGAYRFIIRPGAETTTDVKVALFPRRETAEFGVAPLTSMFLHDDNGRAIFSDYRPEVHDADGLLMRTGRGEWVWRPLEKGKMLRVNAFQDRNPRGFGLLQRNRNFERYQDVVAHFERRPSVWIEPMGDWGEGAVELIQLPSDREFADNVVAFWKPAAPPKPGSTLELEYNMRWMLRNPGPDDLGRARATRVGRVVVEPPVDPPQLRLVIDFEGAALAKLPADAGVTARIEGGAETPPALESLFKNPHNQTWRLVIQAPEPNHAVDFRAWLTLAGRPITETWSFTWQP